MLAEHPKGPGSTLRSVPCSTYRQGRHTYAFFSFLFWDLNEGSKSTGSGQFPKAHIVGTSLTNKRLSVSRRYLRAMRHIHVFTYTCIHIHITYTYTYTCIYVFNLSFQVGTYMGGAFQEKLVGQNDPLTGCSSMLRYKNKKLNAEMSTNV